MRLDGSFGDLRRPSRVRGLAKLSVSLHVHERLAGGRVETGPQHDRRITDDGTPKYLRGETPTRHFRYGLALLVKLVRLPRPMPTGHEGVGSSSRRRAGGRYPWEAFRHREQLLRIALWRDRTRGACLVFSLLRWCVLELSRAFDRHMVHRNGEGFKRWLLFRHQQSGWHLEHGKRW